MTQNHHTPIPTAPAKPPADSETFNAPLGELDEAITDHESRIGTLENEFPPKSNVPTEYLNGTGNWTVPAGTGASIDGHVIQDEGIALPQRSNLNFVGAGVTVTNEAGGTQVEIPGGGHVIQDEGVDLPQREKLNFVGNGVTVTDQVGGTQIEIPGAGSKAIYGSGQDGNVIFNGENEYPFASLSGSTYTILRNVYCENMTVSAGITIHLKGLCLFGRGTLTNDGIIHNNGENASGVTGGSSTGMGIYFNGSSSGANGIASGSAAANGTAGSKLDNTLATGLGGRGAGAWASQTTFLGTGGGQLNLAYPLDANEGDAAPNNLIRLLSRNGVNTGGFGGGSGAKSAVGTSCFSGGGGAGGGLLLLAFTSIINTGTISCNGGNGGNAGGTGANAGGGGGGGGGIVWLIYSSLNNSGTISANGGIGGTSVGDGSNPLRAVARQISNSNSGASKDLWLTLSTNGIVPAKNTLYLLAVHLQSSVLEIPTVNGWGLTWNLVSQVDFDSSGRRLLLFSAYGTPAPLRDNATIKLKLANTPTAWQGSLIEIQNATDVIVQSQTASSASATTLTVTLPNTFSSSHAAAFGVFAFGGGSTRVAGSGFVIVSDLTTSAQLTTELGYNDTTVDISWTTAVAAAGIAIEIQAVGAMENGKNGLEGRVIYIQN